MSRYRRAILIHKNRILQLKTYENKVKIIVPMCLCVTRVDLLMMFREGNDVSLVSASLFLKHLQDFNLEQKEQTE